MWRKVFGSILLVLLGIVACGGQATFDPDERRGSDAGGDIFEAGSGAPKGVSVPDDADATLTEPDDASVPDDTDATLTEPDDASVPGDADIALVDPVDCALDDFVCCDESTGWYTNDPCVTATWGTCPDGTTRATVDQCRAHLPSTGCNGLDDAVCPGVGWECPALWRCGLYCSCVSESNGDAARWSCTAKLC
jgi:hypothetical protein